eukprot:15318075-Ditylum_brightwellii.AAC.1
MRKKHSHLCHLEHWTSQLNPLPHPEQCNKRYLTSKILILGFNKCNRNTKRQCRHFGQNSGKKCNK